MPGIHVSAVPGSRRMDCRWQLMVQMVNERSEHETGWNEMVKCEKQSE
jgi:hypothetical protein